MRTSSYEHYGNRLRLVVGDLSMGEDNFEPGGEFRLCLAVSQDVDEFADYGPTWPKDHLAKVRRLSHLLTVCLWRWGVYVSVAGRKVTA